MFVDANFKPVPERNVGDELVMICPQPGCGDRSGNRSVNLKTGKTACFRCNINGNFVPWLRRLGFVVDDDDNTSSTTDELSRMLEHKGSRTITPAMSNIRLPEGCHRIVDALESAYTRAIERMAIKKNLTLDDMIRADVMFTRMDNYWEPYAIFPIKEWDRLVLFQGRLVTPVEGDTRLAKKFPANSQATFGARYWVYNIDRLRQEGGVAVVVESILNVLSLERKLRQEACKGVVPICVFKHSISSNQLAKIRACKGVTEVCIMYDADATASARKQAVELSNFYPTTVAEMPWTKERPTLDPNDDIATAWRQFLGRRPVSISDELLADSSGSATAKNLWRARRRQADRGNVRRKDHHSADIDELNAMCRSGGSYR